MGRPEAHFPMDLADLVFRERTAIVPRSRHWRRSTSIAATPSPTGSFVIATVRRMPRSRRCSAPGGTFRRCATPSGSRPGSIASSSMPATWRRVAPGAGMPASASTRFPPTPLPDPAHAVVDRVEPRGRLRAADSGTARRRRPPSPPRIPADGDRGNPRNPGRDRALPAVLRGPSAADRARRGRRVRRTPGERSA